MKFVLTFDKRAWKPIPSYKGFEAESIKEALAMVPEVLVNSQECDINDVEDFKDTFRNVVLHVVSEENIVDLSGIAFRTFIEEENKRAQEVFEAAKLKESRRAAKQERDEYERLKKKFEKE